jgi:predicted NACHT family NTPase
MDQKIEARDNSVIQNVTQISHVHVDSAEPISQRERSIMIERVKGSWITGILLPSLRSATRLELQFDCAHSVGPVGVRSIRNLDNNQTRDYQRTLDTSFAERGEVIVIVGAPGSGKSTALLQLMDRLLEEARAETSAPIPAIFQLSSWHRGQTIESWLTEQLIAAYEIPPSKAAGWVNAAKVLPLLDGLDEVPAAERSICM